MKFVMTLNCDTKAFEEDPDEEVAKILKGVSNTLRDGLESNPTVITDSLGEVVGSFEFINDLSPL